MAEPDYAAARQRMLMTIAAQTIYASAQLGKAALNRRVMDAMAKVPRHEFVPLDMRAFAYDDTPLPIGCGKTISQPFIVAVMTDLIDIAPTDKVLEIGTGLGYQTAVLAELAQWVYSVELIEELAAGARQRFARQGRTHIDIRVGNGRAGWPEHAPFDKVIVTAAPKSIPPALIEQLKCGGKMVAPPARTKRSNSSLSTRTPTASSRRRTFCACTSRCWGTRSRAAETDVSRR